MAAETVYTLEEVKQHNNRASLWIVLHNKVYDVTKFMDEHPGGEEVLLELAGQDATESFEDVGHSADAREMTHQYCVGVLAEHQRTPVQQPNTGPGGYAKATAADAGGMSWLRLLVPLAVALGAALIYRSFFANWHSH